MVLSSSSSVESEHDSIPQEDNIVDAENIEIRQDFENLEMSDEMIPVKQPEIY